MNPESLFNVTSPQLEVHPKVTKWVKSEEKVFPPPFLPRSLTPHMARSYTVDPQTNLPPTNQMIGFHQTTTKNIGFGIIGDLQPFSSGKKQLYLSLNNYTPLISLKEMQDSFKTKRERFNFRGCFSFLLSVNTLILAKVLWLSCIFFDLNPDSREHHYN